MTFLLSVIVMSSSGGLLSEHLPAGVRLLDGPDVAVGVVVGASPASGLEGLTRGELEAERAQLLESHRSVAPGIILLSAGALTGVVGFGLLLTGVLLPGGALALVAALAVTFGIILMVGAIVQNRRNSVRLRAVEYQLRAVPPPGQPPVEMLPLTPPPPPPSVSEGPREQQTMILASF